MQKLKGDELKKALTVARLIWLRRNSFVFQREFTPPSQLATSANELFSQFRQATAVDEAPGVNPKYSRWTKPPIGWLKTNWDAAIDVERKKMGLGVVVRDARGEVQVAMAQVIPYLIDSIVAESMATWRPVSFYLECGFSKLLLEGDSLTVVSELCK